MDRLYRLSPHFRVGEFVPKDCREVPDEVLEELTDLCGNLLEPIRKQFGAVVITSGYRPSGLNAKVGGVAASDHVAGRAADFYLTGNSERTWEERTIEGYRWAVDALDGKYGQLILEDHRAHYAAVGKLWVHIASPSVKHPGGGWNSRLVSYQPGKYEPYGGNEA